MTVVSFILFRAGDSSFSLPLSLISLSLKNYEVCTGILFQQYVYKKDLTIFAFGKHQVE